MAKKKQSRAAAKKPSAGAAPPATLDTLDAMLSDVYVRTSGGVSKLFTGLSGVYDGGRKRLLAGF